jgi:AcrR family transcriptional regulator
VNLSSSTMRRAASVFPVHCPYDVLRPPRATATAPRRPAQPRRHRRSRPAGVLRPRPGSPLEQIARQAGVGIATLYRRFPSRAALLDAVLTDNLQAHIDAAEQALATDDPWDGFTHYLEQSCRLQATDRGLNDVMGMRFPRATATEAAKTRLYELVGQLVDRAQQSGQLRADLTLEDLAFLNWANTRILPAVRAAGAPDAWRRHLGRTAVSRGVNRPGFIGGLVA